MIKKISILIYEILVIATLVTICIWGYRKTKPTKPTPQRGHIQVNSRVAPVVGLVFHFNKL